MFCRMRFDHPDDHPDGSSGSVWTDGPANVSRLDSFGAVQVDAEHPSRNRKVEASNPSSGSITAGQSACEASCRSSCLPA